MVIQKNRLEAIEKSVLFQIKILKELLDGKHKYEVKNDTIFIKYKYNDTPYHVYMYKSENETNEEAIKRLIKTKQYVLDEEIAYNKRFIK